MVSTSICGQFGAKKSRRTCRRWYPQASPATPAAHSVPKMATGPAGDGLHKHLMQLLRPIRRQERSQDLQGMVPTSIYCNSRGPFGTKNGHRTCRRLSPQASPTPPAAHSAPKKATGPAGDGIHKHLLQLLRPIRHQQRPQGETSPATPAAAPPAVPAATTVAVFFPSDSASRVGHR